MVGSPKKKSVVKEEKYEKKRKSREYKTPTFFSDIKLKEKFE